MKPLWTAFAFAIGLSLTTPALAADANTQPLRVLVVLGSPPYHNIHGFADSFQATLKKVGGFQATLLQPAADKKPDDPSHLARLATISRSDYDVLVFYTSQMQLTSDEENGLKKFLEDGGGIVAIHGASLSFSKSDWWTHLLSCRFTGHIPGTHKLNVVILDHKHPITAGVPDFSIVDEEYKHRFVDEPRHVLARFRERPPEEKEQNANPDILWTRHIGKNGRLFYSALGHDQQAWNNPHWQKLILQGICWAAHHPREVSIPEAESSK